MQLISHQNHIDQLPDSSLKTYIQNRFNQLAVEDEDIPPIIILVEADDEITGSDYAFIGPNGLLSDLWEEHEP